MAAPKRAAAPSGPGRTWIARAWKWGAGSLSAGAALVSMISSVRSITGAQQVRWIGVVPAADTVWALGDTIQLATTMTDAHGGVLPGVSVGWTSTDTAVASVDSAGTVVARAAGATTVVAAAGGRIAQSRILVRPRPAGIRLFGDSLLRLPEGGGSRLVARVVDARRHPVPGQVIAWRSVDPTVAEVDSAGRLTAIGSGHTMLVASSGELAAELPLEIYPVPASITLLAGDGQRAPAGARLPAPIKAQVVSRGGRPMAAVPIRFAVEDEGGRVDRGTDTTDAGGIAQAGWTLGGRAGRQRLELVVEGEAPIGTYVMAEADPVPGNTRTSALAEEPVGRVGETLPSAVGIRVSDSTGAPLAGVPVSWAADGGSITGEGPRTDSLGEARARWTLGSRSGTQRAFAQVGGARAVPRFALSATATPGPAVALAPVGGAPLRGQVGGPVAPALKLCVSDRDGNPVSGVAITVRTPTGSASLESPVTDSAGRVVVQWTLGPAAGTQRLIASAAGLPHPVELTAQARAGRAARLSLAGVPPSATAGLPLPQPLVALVSDSFGNPVPGALVAFTSRTGKLAPARARSDSAGRAQTRWTLGAAPGEQTVQAVAGASGEPVVAKVRALAPVKRRR